MIRILRVLSALYNAKGKITELPNYNENSKYKVPYQMAWSNAQSLKQMENNFHIPDLIQTFPFAENGRLNLVS